MQLWILILFSELPRHLEKSRIFAKCLILPIAYDMYVARKYCDSENNLQSGL